LSSIKRTSKIIRYTPQRKVFSRAIPLRVIDVKSEFPSMLHTRLRNMAIACAGYRIMSKVGHYRVSLESTKLVLGKPAHKYADILRPVGESEALSTTRFRTQRPRQKQKRSSLWRPSFRARSKTGSRKTTLR
jgi:hypothetical protein